VLQAASTEQGSQAWARRLLDSEESNLAVALQWAAQQHIGDHLLRRLGDVWVWALVRGNLRRSTALRQQIEAWPAASLSDERDQMARWFLVMIGTNSDGRWSEVGALADRVLPEAWRIEEPSRWGNMLLVRALSRPYARRNQAARPPPRGGMQWRRRGRPPGPLRQLRRAGRCGGQNRCERERMTL